IGEVLKPVFEVLKEVFKAVFEVLKPVFEVLKEVFKPVLELLRVIAEIPLLNTIIKIGLSLIPGVGPLLSAAWSIAMAIATGDPMGILMSVVS
ncbi:MAG: hypothetical protein QME68_07860, partial [Elusimicrobiota bacterium]|nr:hypothetical protein [Elusimicrobiota bacterium]